MKKSNRPFKREVNKAQKKNSVKAEIENEKLGTNSEREGAREKRGGTVGKRVRGTVEGEEDRG